MKVVIIGTGNVANVLGKKIQEAGNEIIQVVGRNFEKAEQLAARLNTASVFNLRYINLWADIYIIAVSDAAISAVASQLKLGNKIVVHTAAAVSKDVLSACSENCGILYPLQSLVKDMPAIPSIPVLIDANNETTEKIIKDFSTGWSEMVRVANDEERVKLHIAAVFVSNFPNYLFAVAEQYCKREQLKFRMLYPLIEETIAKIKYQSPSAVQTGPAVREDYTTIEEHKEILKNFTEMNSLYNQLTNSIIKFYDKSKSLNKSTIIPPKSE